MSGNIRSLQRQLSEAEENVRLVEERMARYVHLLDVPLQLVTELAREANRLPWMAVERLENEEGLRRHLAE